MRSMPTRIDTSAKDLAVLKAIAERGPTGSAITVSIRELMAETGLGRGTICRSIDRLIKRGRLVRLKGSSHTQHAHRYRVLEETRIDHKTSFLWSNYGLGASALIIFSSMPIDEWLTIHRLRDLVNCSESTIRTALLKLHSAGLVNGVNLVDDQLTSKRQWMRLDDVGYLHKYEDWLTRSAQESVKSKVKKEQAQWRFTERNRFCGNQPHWKDARTA